MSKLREYCDKHGALLIFDEVISGFRFKDGSYGDLSGVTPDITALGKVIGGGLPVGAYGARSEIMQSLSPLGPVYQAGTLSGNPLAMAAGIMTLDLLDDDAYDRLEELGQLLESTVVPVLEKHGNPMRLVRRGTCFGFHYVASSTQSRPNSGNAGKLYSDVHKGLRRKGTCLRHLHTRLVSLQQFTRKSIFLEWLERSMKFMRWR